MQRSYGRFEGNENEALSLVGERWLVDWEGYAEFRYKRFAAFLADPGSTTGTYRVLIKPELASLGDTGRQPYSAATPDLELPTTIYAAEDSKVYQDLEDVIGAFLDQQLARYRSAPEEAKKAIAFGESNAPEDVNPVELAAWTLVGNLILNLDERPIHGGVHPQRNSAGRTSVGELNRHRLSGPAHHVGRCQNVSVLTNHHAASHGIP